MQLIILTDLPCPLCDSELTEEDAHGARYWKCPFCLSETWPDEDRIEYLKAKELEESERQAKKKAEVEERKKMLMGIAKPGREILPLEPIRLKGKGGGARSGRKRSSKKPAANRPGWLYQ